MSEDWLEKARRSVLMRFPNVFMATSIAGGAIPPEAAAVYVGLELLVLGISERNKKTFDEEFGQRKEQIAKEVLCSLEFARAFERTMQTLRQTSSPDKVKMQARLLHRGAVGGLINDLDQYSGYVRISEELTLQELLILRKMDGFKNWKWPARIIEWEGMTDVDRRKLKDKADKEVISNIGGQTTAGQLEWETLCEELESMPQLSEGVLPGLFARLSGKGLLITRATYSDKPRYGLSENYYGFKEWIKNENDRLF